MTDIQSIGARHQRCPRECRPIDASVIWERYSGYVRTRAMRCNSCGQRWRQHCYS